MVSDDTIAREAQRVQRIGRTLRNGGLHLVGVYGDARARQINRVEPLRQLDQRVVAASPHIGDNRGDRLAHVGRRLALLPEQSGKVGGE